MEGDWRRANPYLVAGRGLCAVDTWLTNCHFIDKKGDYSSKLSDKTAKKPIGGYELFSTLEKIVSFPADAPPGKYTLKENTKTFILKIYLKNWNWDEG